MDPATTTCRPASIALPVLSAKPAPRASRMGRWRAAVLIAVHLVIIIHIVQWLLHGLTLSPVEPSESMYAIELGRLNAGFIFFSLALASTFLFGRFFCGWGCHVVALQDLCAHWMTKLGVRPKPFRTRLLPLWSLALALYMFVWPAFKRHLLFPILGPNKPDWLADVAPFPGFHSEFIVTDFWATFAPWYWAIPFLLVCGFACVYVLGSKSFCTYACPYGGFFAPLDKLSIGRIVVSDACHQCGHCTAACTSNVRVHQEVLEFGKVMDPGCMKCLDCVSVCPNDALSFAFAAPAVATPRRASAPATPRPRPPYDLTLTGEVIVFFVGIAYFLAFRQMLGQIPLLMAAGIAIIAAGASVLAWRLVTAPNARLQNLQLKLKGSIRPAGWAFALAFLALTATAAWSGAVRLQAWRAELIDRAIRTPPEFVFAPDYKPQPSDALQASAALDLYAFSDSRAQGGFGWEPGAETRVRQAWLSAVKGDLDAAERYMNLAVHLRCPSPAVMADMVTLRHANLRRHAGDVPDAPTPQMAESVYASVLEVYPDNADVRIMLAQVRAAGGHPEAALADAARVLADAAKPGREGRGVSAFARVAASELLLSADRADEAIAALQQAKTVFPKEALVRAALARAFYMKGRIPDAVTEMNAATILAPADTRFLEALADLYDASGDHAKAETARKRLAELRTGIHQPPEQK